MLKTKVRLFRDSSISYSANVSMTNKSNQISENQISFIKFSLANAAEVDWFNL